MDSQNVIDSSVFTALKETMGADFVVELVQTYAEETPQLLASLQEALAKQDCETFNRAAHSIKSASNSMGALKLGEMAKELEIMGREKNLAGAASKVEALVSVFAQVKLTLEELTHA